MTVETTSSRVQYSTNGTTGPFSVPFYFITEGELSVIYADSTGAETELVLNTDYSVSGEGDPAGGSVTTNEAYGSGGTITIRRVPSLLQETDYTDTDRFPAVAHERALDRAIMAAQYIKEITDRCLQIPVSGGEDVSLPGVSDRAGKFLTFDESGNARVSVPAAGSVDDLAFRLAQGDVDNGAALVGFIQDSVLAVRRTLQARGADRIHAKDFALLGDGATDETTKLSELLALAAGKLVELEAGKTYVYNPTTGLTFPAGARVITNGAKFKESVASSDFRVEVQAGATIDHLEVDFLGATNSRGIKITGGNVTIGRLVARSLAAQTGAGNIRRRALRIGEEGGARISDVRIGSVEISDWDYGVAVFRTDRLRIDWLGIQNYRAGLWAQDLRYSQISGGYMRGLSASSTGVPGENGTLIEATEHNGSTQIHLRNIHVEDSGEHGHRIGGSKVVSHVTYTNCSTRNTGAADGTGIEPDDHGGCGFKCLGSTDAANPGSYHQNIRYVDCVVEDVDYSLQGNNFAGFHIGKTNGFSLVNPVVRKSIKTQASDTYTPPSYSCETGIEIIGSMHGTITNPQIIAPAQYGIRFFDANDGNDWGSENSKIKVVGGFVDLPGEAGVAFSASAVPMRRLQVVGLHVEGGKRHSIAAASGSGSFIACRVDGTYLNGTDTLETITGLTDFQVVMSGAEVGSNACANGSTFQSFTDGTIKVRAAGAWVPLDAGSAGTLAGDLANTAVSGKGAGMVGFAQTLSYAAGTAGAHARRRISANTAGCDVAGDVTSALSTAMSLAVSLGAEFEMTAGRTYQIGSSLTIPAGLTLITHGAIFEDLNGTASNTAFVTVQTGCVIDQLVVSIPTGKVRDRAIRLNAADVQVGVVKLTSVDQIANTSDTDDAGVSILANNIQIGRLIVDGYDRAIKIAASNVQIGVLQQSRFVRGCWITDSSYVSILSGRSYTLSANAAVSPGHNAFLVGCDTVGATHNITLVDQVVEAAGEHGIRLAGPQAMRNVFLIRPRVRNAGACGIKIRGTDGVGSIYNLNIVIEDAVVEDCGTSASFPTAYNRCGILAEWVDGLTIKNPTIRPRSNPNCAGIGLRVNACKVVEISGGKVQGAQHDNVLIHANEADVEDTLLSNMVLKSAGRDALSVIVDATRTAQTVHAVGMVCRGSTSYGLNVAVAGTASDVNLDVRTVGNTAGAAACNSTSVGLEVSGAPGATAITSVSASNSSQWRDGTNTYIRKAGAWTAL